MVEPGLFCHRSTRIQCEIPDTSCISNNPLTIPITMDIDDLLFYFLRHHGGFRRMDPGWFTCIEEGILLSLRRNYIVVKMDIIDQCQDMRMGAIVDQPRGREQITLSHTYTTLSMIAVHIPSAWWVITGTHCDAMHNSMLSNLSLFGPFALKVSRFTGK